MCILGCSDTLSWSDRYEKNCEYYAQVYCENRSVKPGMEFALGAANNYPEENCCVCGKPKGIYIYLNLQHKIFCNDKIESK